jgi:predicted transcriptional regulator
MALYAHRAELTPAQRLALGERLAELRGGVAVRALARLAGVDDKTLRRIEAGEVDPSLGTLLALVSALDLCSVEELLTGRRFGTTSLLQSRDDEVSA